MARIRSTHPGQWTDEGFISCSPLARLLCLGIRNEADDQGIFEWKPVTLKLRLLPVDNVDIGALLSELEANNQIKRFEAGGRQFGAIRNFRRFQRPKSPKAVWPMPDDFRNYVGLTAAHSEIDDDEEGPIPPAAEPDTYNMSGVPESNEQREEVGGKREKNPPILADFEAWYQAYPRRVARKAAEKAYKKARETATAEQLLAGARAYADDPQRKPEFTKHPATWLNGECWLDEGAGGPSPTPDRDAGMRALIRLGFPPSAIAAMTDAEIAAKVAEKTGAVQNDPELVSRETPPSKSLLGCAGRGESCLHDSNDPACDFFIPPGNRRAAE